MSLVMSGKNNEKYIKYLFFSEIASNTHSNPVLKSPNATVAADGPNGSGDQVSDLEFQDPRICLFPGCRLYSVSERSRGFSALHICSTVPPHLYRSFSTPIASLSSHRNINPSYIDPTFHTRSIGGVCAGLRHISKTFWGILEKFTIL